MFTLQVDPLTHQVKICDFGSAKVLVSHLKLLLDIQTAIFIKFADFNGWMNLIMLSCWLYVLVKLQNTTLEFQN